MGAERVLMAARREEGVGMGEEVRGLRSTGGWLQNRPEDVKYTTGNIVTNIVKTVWCQGS